MDADAIIDFYAVVPEASGWAIATASADTEHAEAVFTSALRAAKAVERDPLMLAASAHLLVSATAQR